MSCLPNRTERERLSRLLGATRLRSGYRLPRPLISCLVVSVLLGMPVGAGAAKQLTIGVLPVVAEGRVPAKVSRALDAAVDFVAKGVVEKWVISGLAVGKSLRVNARAAAKKCDDDLACFRELGRRLGADQLLIARVRMKEWETRARFFLVDVESSTILQTALFRFKSGEDFKAKLRKSGSELWGDDLPTEDQSPALAGLVVPTAAGDKEDPRVEEIAAAPIAQQEPTGLSRTGSESGNEAAPSVTRYIAFGTIALGGLLAATSGYFGIRSHLAASEIDEKGAGTTSQLRAQTLEKRANDARGTAGWLILSGTVAAALGGATLFVDRFISESTVTAAISRDSAHVGLALTW